MRTFRIGSGPASTKDRLQASQVQPVNAGSTWKRVHGKQRAPGRQTS